MHSSIVLSSLLVATSALAQTPRSAPPPVPGPAAVMVIEDGGLDPATVRTVRGLTATELRQRGIGVINDRRFDQVVLPGDEVKQALHELGASKLYALQMGKLGQKIILTLEELSADRLESIFSTSLAVGGVEEVDRVLPRLVDAVLDRRSAADNATLTTVSSSETPAPRKKYGTTMGIIGLTFGFNGSAAKSYTKPFGMNGSLSYEIEHWRVDLQGFIESHGSGSTGFLGIGGDWIPLDGEISPYLSFAVGYSVMGGSDGTNSYSDNSVSGMGLKVGAGIEFLRLHNFRVLGGLDLLIPIYDTAPIHVSSPVTPLFHIGVAFQ